MLSRRRLIHTTAVVLLLLTIAVGATEHAGPLPVGRAGHAAGVRLIRIQKVTPSVSHPAHEFGILVGPGQPPIFTTLEANATLGPIHELMLPESELWVAEGPQQAGWQRGGYALISDPAGTAQCSPNLSFGTDYSQVVIPAGSAKYLVCVRNTYQAPDVRLTEVKILSASFTSVTLSYRIANAGTVYLDTRGWKLEAWASQDGVLDIGQDLAAADWFLSDGPLLGPGAEYEATRAVSLQVGSFVGSRNLIVRILPGFPESNDANNLVSATVTLGPIHRLFVADVTTYAGCTACKPVEAPSQSLSLSVSQVDPSERSVLLNGADTRRPTIPFTFDWGDGTVTTGFFPQSHHYPAPGEYTVRVTAHYAGGVEGHESVIVEV